MVDFTLAAYSKLLDGVRDLGYEVVTVRDWLRQDPVAGHMGDSRLVLRHDAEWDPRRAMDKARVEANKGIRATYYFRADTSVYHLPTMHEIQDMGHEIGYHFNVLDRCRGETAASVELFEADLARFRQEGFVVDTVCSHGDPRAPKNGYKVNNEIMLRDPEMVKRNGLLGEAYLDMDFSALKSISDVGIRWNVAESTEGLLRLLEVEKPPAIQILTHPDYWSRSAFRSLGLRGVAKTMRVTKVNARITGVKRLFRAVSGAMRGQGQ